MPDPATLGMMVDPQDYADAMRQQQLSQLLTQQAFTPDQPQAAGRIVPRASPLMVPSKILEAWMANRSFKKSADAQQRYATALMGTGNQYLDTATGRGAAPGDYGQRMEALNRAVQFGLVDPEMAKQIGTQIGAENKPSELDAALRGAGIMPGTPEYQTISAQLAKKGIYIAPAEVKENNLALDSNNRPILQNPGRQWVADPRFPGQGHWETAPPLPGVPTAGQVAAPMPAGQAPAPAQVPAAGQIPASAPAPSAPAPPKNYMGAPPQAPQLQVPPPGHGRFDAGDLAALQKSGESGIAYSDKLSADAEQATQVRRALTELKGLAKGAGVSVANPMKLKVGSMLVAAGADPTSVSKMLGTKLDDLVEASHETGSLALNSIKEMHARGTNFDLSTFMSLNPGLNMATTGGFNRLVDYMDKTMRDAIDRQADFQQWKRGQPASEWTGGHTQHWLEKVNRQIDSGETQGSSNAGSAPPSASPRVYKTEADAKSARARGEINNGDPIMVAGRSARWQD